MPNKTVLVVYSKCPPQVDQASTFYSGHILNITSGSKSSFIEYTCMNAYCIPEPDQTAMKPGPKKKKNIENALPLYEAYIPMVGTKQCNM